MFCPFEITALLHTWGQNLGEHPHRHCLVTEGGLVTPLEDPPRWRGPKQARHLFPVQAVAAIFAGKFPAGLQQRPATGRIEFHGRLESWRDPAPWEWALASLRLAKWVVFGYGSVVGPEPVLDYLGRYTHRVAISNGRLLSMDERTVTFGYKDYRQDGALRQMTLPGLRRAVAASAAQAGEEVRAPAFTARPATGIYQDPALRDFGEQPAGPAGALGAGGVGELALALGEAAARVRAPARAGPRTRALSALWQ